jgi:hypothetical protein
MPHTLDNPACNYDQPEMQTANTTGLSADRDREAEANGTRHADAPGGAICVLSSTTERRKICVIRDLRSVGDNTLLGRLVVMRTPDSFFLVKDGDMWCAAPPDFHDLQQDPTGWGSTHEEAVQDLVGSTEFQDRAAQQGWNNNPSLSQTLPC